MDLLDAARYVRRKLLLWFPAVPLAAHGGHVKLHGEVVSIPGEGHGLNLSRKVVVGTFVDSVVRVEDAHPLAAFRHAECVPQMGCSTKVEHTE